MSVKTTYFLGAGASKALYSGLPLASELTLEFLLDRRGLPVGFDDAIERVEDYSRALRWPREKRSAPFEQIYPEIPANLEPFWPRENLEICLFRKLKLGTEFLTGRGLPHSWLEHNVYSGNPIITPNYDILIEWAVENLQIGPVGFGESGLIDYGVPNDLCLPLVSAGPRLDGRVEKLLLLKLYGSMTWSRCQQCGKYLLETIYEAEGANAIMGRGRCRGCGGTRRNAVFVPLVADKEPKDPALCAIWARAEEVLSKSGHILFAGFSLHPGDQKIRDMLRRAFSSGLTKKVTVVQRRRDPETLARYEAIYGDCVESYDKGWAQYLDEFG